MYFVQKTHKVDVLHKFIIFNDVDYFNDFREDEGTPRASRGDELKNYYVLSTVKLNLSFLLNLRRQKKFITVLKFYQPEISF